MRTSKSICILLFLLFVGKVNAQTSMTMSITDFLNWQPTTLNQDNISLVPLAQRMKSPNYQINANVDTNARILYSPDGMNNFGPYIDSAAKFNLFNFSHWQYIDILAWFGGSAGTPILIPSKAWVDCAHKNGVKVIGTIFFAPAVYGGSQAQVQSFLVKDSTGQFIAAHQLKALADYYNFDGWIFNAETSVNSTTGALFSNFITELDSIYTGTTIWYDAMLQSGTVSYQNKLDASNAFFFQHTSGIFTNYGWSSATTVASSATYATSVGRSPYDVYTGADMWPSRTAQPAFTNYTWIDKIFPAPSGLAKTSIAMFATNFTFNYGPFSTFNNDSTQSATFYAAERKIFSGLDQDPFIADATWKGIGNYVAVKTPFTTFPFETDFNTGHGMNYYSNGTILSAAPWHNMSHQSTLPSWTFYSSSATIDYDFTDAYNGGSSLKIAGASATTYFIPLYSTALVPNSNSLFSELALKSVSTTIDSIGIEFQTKSGSGSVLTFFHPTANGSWEDLLNPVVPVVGNDTIIAINLVIHSSGAFIINIGKINIEANITGINSLTNNTHSSLLVYPNPSNGNVTFKTDVNSKGTLNIYDLSGKKVANNFINGGDTLNLKLKSAGVYMYEFKSNDGIKQGKIIVN